MADHLHTNRHGALKAPSSFPPSARNTAQAQLGSGGLGSTSESTSPHASPTTTRLLPRSSSNAGTIHSIQDHHSTLQAIMESAEQSMDQLRAQLAKNKEEHKKLTAKLADQLRAKIAKTKQELQVFTDQLAELGSTEQEQGGMSTKPGIPVPSDESKTLPSFEASNIPSLRLTNIRSKPAGSSVMVCSPGSSRPASASYLSSPTSGTSPELGSPDGASGRCHMPLSTTARLLTCDKRTSPLLTKQVTLVLTLRNGLLIGLRTRDTPPFITYQPKSCLLWPMFSTQSPYEFSVVSVLLSE